MRKVGIVSLIFTFVLIATFILQATDTASAQEYRKRIGEKAERGVGNALFGWTEIPKKVVDITKESNNPFWGLVAGVFQGTLKAFARTTSGVVDIATCGIKNDEKPFVQPDMDVD